MAVLDRTTWRKVGTTLGLVQEGSGDRGGVEQGYVFLDPHDNHRPVIVEGWVGYSVEGRMRLTRRQATELSKLLIDAVTETTEERT